MMSKTNSLDTLINCKSISKKFCKDLKKSLWYGVKDSCSDLFKGEAFSELRDDEFWALKNISFDLSRGECLGLLGRNGAGKTTLLKILSGLIKPDKGEILMKGKVGGLIALGAGFNGLLTGRENVHVNGAILGYSKPEVERKIEEIIDFSELGDFIDAPVQTYSSGMNVRLGFAIATVLTKPDILLLDEVLAVGDIGFTVKCLNAVRQMMKNSAVIFVSHNMQYISRFCSKVLYLDKGSLISAYENVAQGIEEYLSNMDAIDVEIEDGSVELSDFNMNGAGIKDGEKMIKVDRFTSSDFSFTICSKDGKDHLVLVYISIHDQSGNKIITYQIDEKVLATPNQCMYVMNLGSLELNSGSYSFVVAVMEKSTERFLLRCENILPFSVIADSFEWAYIVRKSKLVKKVVV